MPVQHQGEPPPGPSDLVGQLTLDEKIQLVTARLGIPALQMCGAGVEQGFHGEAALLPWTLSASDAASATLSVEQVTSPLRLLRRVRVDGPTVTVQDTITNLSPDPVEFDYQHHPAFGAPLPGPDCLIETGARDDALADRA